MLNVFKKYLRRCLKNKQYIFKKFLSIYNIERCRRKSGIFTSFFIYFMTCVVIFIFYFVITVFMFGISEKSGQFGDTFGPLTSLFSGLAFCGIIISLYLQHDDIKLQRLELKLQRIEIHKQAEEIEKQRILAERHEFERIFNLLLIELIKSAEKLDSINSAWDISFTQNALPQINQKRYTKLSANLESTLSLHSGQKSLNIGKKFSSIKLHMSNFANGDISHYRQILANSLSPNVKAFLLLYSYYTIKEEIFNDDLCLFLLEDLHKV